jgi:predicted permease
VLHPLCVAFGVLYLFQVTPFSAMIAIAAASLPVAGNVYMLAQHYGVAPHRASAAILISTLLSIVTVPLVIAWVSTL